MPRLATVVQLNHLMLECVGKIPFYSSGPLVLPVYLMGDAAQTFYHCQQKYGSCQLVSLKTHGALYAAMAIECPVRFQCKVAKIGV